jgi:P27 family predicted phage terminase small subunit
VIRSSSFPYPSSFPLSFVTFQVTNWTGVSSSWNNLWSPRSSESVALAARNSVLMYWRDSQNNFAVPISSVLANGRNRVRLASRVGRAQPETRNAMPRQPKTAKENWLEGTVSQAKPSSPSQFQGGRPKFPKHLSPVAKQEFKCCVQLLEERGTVTPADKVILAVYSEVYARWIQAKREIGDSLMLETTLLDSHGVARVVRRINPLLKTVETCESKMVALAAKLGLTPIDREKSKPTQPHEDSSQPLPGTIGWIIEEHARKEAQNADNLPS